MRVRKDTVVVWLVFLLLAGMFWAMSMMEHSGLTRSKSGEIVSNLHSLKTVMLAMYADHADSIDQYGRIDGQTVEDFIESDAGRRKLKEYMTGDALTLKGGNAAAGEYKLASEQSSRSWFVGYGLNSQEDMNTTRKLAARAERDGLLNYSAVASPPYNGKLTQWVWMQILGE